ncbi:preprotein translocase subunit SecA [Mycoplasma crocodyli]|uniref:Protein translocase subunit SecA n=1 Tax=Mycoplasma crocodyli (strain ATCC 51981 / MP145) TaxID=512564 RepID=D5E5H9_MYCCM|nr:preprotein translocase subunit SecA [Mycoplasma crocodyli]ADE19994.1 preprotein translocase, SecA subunit [Mycoplasma crocodyli MP145]
MNKLKKFFNITSTEMKIAKKALNKINSLEERVVNLSNEELKSKTELFKTLLKQGYNLDDIRNEAFAVAREATKRVLKKRPFDVQILGGLLLDIGSVAEMKTGEGKTITSIAPVYLNALTGKSVIVSTVNEYLSERDAIEMGEVYNFLGLTVGINKASLDPYEKRKAYAADITYSVHSEMGFDYLRDNMVSSLEEKVQRGHYFCLVDEVDSILIDEAKTPLIISGGDKEDTQTYFAADQFVRLLTPKDYVIDDESKAISLTHSGIERANNFYGIKSLYDMENSEIVHRISNALRAHKVMKNNVEYIVRDGKIELVDAFTGRIMDGRSYSEGLQQALQAKEMVEVEPETKTLATITYQNFFRMFTKLCGMSGTAKTEEQEFIDIYNMRVNVVPTNLPIIRIDEPDSIFASAQAKWKAVVIKIKELYSTRQPILVGTAQIEDSEILHELLTAENIPHQVLNAKQNAAEAEIISRAGEAGTITIATNMAGRGTDIKLTAESVQLGGLYVLGTDKAEARRIDNQLKGRSGRQGDVGTSKFYISLDDTLMQRFSNQESFKAAYASEGDKEITNKNLRFAFNHAQKKIEGFNYDSRKNVLNYDDVIRQQRDLIYSQRDLILATDNISFIIKRMISSTAKSIIKSENYRFKNGSFDFESLIKFLNNHVLSVIKIQFSENELKSMHENELSDYIEEKFLKTFDEWMKNVIENYDEYMLEGELRTTILKILDVKWQNHIDSMDKLRSNINLVQYAQKNPFQVYTDEGTKKFENMIEDIAFDVMIAIFRNPIGRKAIISKEIRADHVFQEIMSTITYNYNLTQEENEINILNMYWSVKNRIEELKNMDTTQQQSDSQLKDEVVDNQSSEK